MQTRQFILPLAEKIIVDLFAGGGGWSTAYEMATGQHVHISINHDSDAISMHEVNHPQSEHYKADVFEVCPRKATRGRFVEWLHLSPDCTHHSQAKGGQPRDRKIRALAWVGIRWAGQVRPDVISLENVKQILRWGPLIAKRDKETGRVIKLVPGLDAKGKATTIQVVAEKGERVPVELQYLIPDPKREGETWKRFVAILESMGYVVEAQRLVAADYGAPTTRDRLFMMARCDGEPIEWPEPSHVARSKALPGKKTWIPAADCIDWSIPSQSIFDRKKALAPATMSRIARGMYRYVLNNADPFIVPIANWSHKSVHSIRDPLTTITASPKGGSHAVVTPVLVQAGYGERKGQEPRSLDLQEPLGTIVAGGVKHALASATLVKFRGDSDGAPLTEPLPTITSGAGAKRPAGNAHAMGVATAFLAQMNGGFNTTPGHDLRRPMTTVTNSGSQQQLVTAHLAHLRGNCDARDLNDPLMTVSAGGQHHGLTSATLESAQPELSPELEEKALRVAAFLIRYYGEGGQLGDLREPTATITTKARLGLVTVYLKGDPYVIVDIQLRMLQPHELYRAQGFPESYIITHGHDGRTFTQSAQVKMCGNSVSPPPAMALIKANLKRRDQHQLKRAA